MYCCFGLSFTWPLAALLYSNHSWLGQVPRRFSEEKPLIGYHSKFDSIIIIIIFISQLNIK